MNACVPNDMHEKCFLDGMCSELVRKLCNTRIQEFLSAWKQETATKKGLASTIDLNLRTMLLTQHTKLASKLF